MICGVCAGIAEYADVDATLVRMICTILTVLCINIFGVILYFLLALIMPKDNDKQILND